VGSRPTALALKIGGDTMPSEVVKPEDVPANLPLINAPEWYVSGAQVLWASNDPILLFNKIIPATPSPPPPGSPPGTVTQGLAFVAPVGMVRMSAETLKELSIALKMAVELREKDIGKPIETEATRQLANQKKA
jgi:hypothetical protein